MPSDRNHRSRARGFIFLGLAAGLATAAAGAEASAMKPARPAAPVAEAKAPLFTDTRTGLQQAFAIEMNAKERYKLFAAQADREGLPAVAHLFRACAEAEQVHADRHVRAIAVTGGEARVLLDKVYAGTTAENLQVAMQGENYEATEFYPALLERSREEGVPDAVRSVNFALSAEREHERLLGAALAGLEQKPEPKTIYVCSYCGKTVESLDFEKCPNCFTAARKFIRVGEAAQAAAPAQPASGVPPGKGAVEPAPPPAPPEPRK